MLSLYFNCRITGKKLIADNIYTHLFYPVAYPKSSNSEYLSQQAVLLKTLESYVPIKFNVAVFNIAIDSIEKDIETQIITLIRDNYSANKIVINFSRPSYLNEWKKDIEYLSSLIEKNDPLLVVMNHDHIFIDYTPDVFESTVNKVFQKTESNFLKTLVYSHAPEWISYLLDKSFVKNEDGIFQREQPNTVASIVIMTVETLQYFLTKALCSESDYIGRVMDWEDIMYQPVPLIMHVYPREYFKHIDGYGHVTGLRMISDLREVGHDSLLFPGDSQWAPLINFYYQKWLDCYVLLIRDSLRLIIWWPIPKRQLFKNISNKQLFRNAIERSLDMFKTAYLEQDVIVGLLDKNKVDFIQSALRSHIYYYGNTLFQSVMTDIELMKKDKIFETKMRIRAIIKKMTPSVIINYYSNSRFGNRK